MISLQVLAVSIAIAAGAALLAAPRTDTSASLSRDSLGILHLAIQVALVVTIAAGTLHAASHSGLWIDEFGTWWTISGGFGKIAERVYHFQGQSPFYYLLAWASARLFGSSDLAVRLPSLLFMSVALVLTGLVATHMRNQQAGRIAFLCALSSPLLLESAINARPYGLAVCAYSCAWLGYVRAVKGRRDGRILFILGSTALFWAHYILAVFVVGFVATHALVRPLRLRYSQRNFTTDCAVVTVVCAPAVPHLHELWLKRHALAWLPSSDFSVALALLLPALIVSCAALLFRYTRDIRRDPFIMAAVLATLLPLVVVYSLTAVGINLLSPRYMLPAGIGAVLIVSLLIDSLQGMRPRAFTGALYVCLALIAPVVTGSFRLLTTFPQDWRAVRTLLDAEEAACPRLLVLYRSGFVEEDTFRFEARAVDLAPLQPPGTVPFRGSVVPLTYSWSPEVAELMSDRVAKALESTSKLYFVSSSNYSTRTGDYGRRLTEWMRQRVPRVQVTRVPCCRGVDVIRFDAKRD